MTVLLTYDITDYLIHKCTQTAAEERGAIRLKDFGLKMNSDTRGGIENTLPRWKISANPKNWIMESLRTKYGKWPG